MIDSHCHLHYDYSPKTVEDLIREAQAEGVDTFITVATDLDSFSQVEKLSESFSCVYHSIGVHPHDTQMLQEEHLKTLEKAAQHPKCKAIGEIGLDYHYNHSNPEIQKKYLELQLDLAGQMNLPVIIHSREAEEDLYLALKKYSEKTQLKDTPGVIHCFSGTLDFGKKCLELGFFISFSGILTFKKAEEIKEAAKIFPLEKILIETDAPYLAPIPFRGKKCEPKMVKMTAIQLAELRNLSFEKISEITTENTKKLFKLS